MEKVCVCELERYRNSVRMKETFVGEYMVYTISLLNTAWWTASGRTQRAASDIDISICVWTCVCVFPSLLLKFSLYTYSVVYVCVMERKNC